VQTFLPFPDFKQSAECLDYRRLGKQRVEAYQILRVLKGITNGWSQHPAVKMWHGYDDALILYMNTMCEEWISRGYKDTMLGRFGYVTNFTLPDWIGSVEFHVSHQSNLLRKDPIYYGHHFKNVPDDLPYIWPTGETP